MVFHKSIMEITLGASSQLQNTAPMKYREKRIQRKQMLSPYYMKQAKSPPPNGFPIPLLPTHYLPYIIMFHCVVPDSASLILLQQLSIVSHPSTSLTEFLPIPLSVHIPFLLSLLDMDWEPVCHGPIISTP